MSWGRKLDGKPIHRTVYGKTQEEVFGKFTEAKRELEQNPERASVRLTLNAFLDDYWLPAVRGGISGKTYDRYVLDGSYVRPYLGRKPLADLNIKLIRRFALRPIRSEDQLNRAIEVVDELIDRDGLDPSEKDYLDVLSTAAL